jgi:hypothetical protein
MNARLKQGREVEYGLPAGRAKEIVRIVYNRSIEAVGSV